MGRFRRNRRFRILDEAEAYARCYGSGDDSVRLVLVEPEPKRTPRFRTRVSGEELRRLFEERLDRREPPA